MSVTRRGVSTGVWFVAPLAIFLLATTLAPIMYVVGLSLFHDYLPKRSVTFSGLANFAESIAAPEFWQSVGNTGVYVAFSVLLHLLVAVTLAIMLDRGRSGLERYARVIRGLLVVPWLLSWAVAAALWKLILDPSGVLNAYLIKLGLLSKQIPWFGTTQYAMVWILVITVWKAFPFFLMLVYAALTTIPGELYESSDIDGAGFFRKIRSITLPMITPTVLTLAILDVVWSLRQFDVIFLTTGGGPLNATRTLTLQVYLTAYEGFRFGLAAAQGVIILIISTVVSIIYIRLYEKVEV